MKPARATAIHRDFDEVLLWAIAQHADVTVDMIMTRWSADRATAYRWRTRCNDFRQKLANMQRRARPIEVCGRPSVLEGEGVATEDARMPGFVGPALR